MRKVLRIMCIVMAMESTLFAEKTNMLSPMGSMAKALPQLARICDVAGIGTIQSSATNWVLQGDEEAIIAFTFKLDVEHYWVGHTTNANPVSIEGHLTNEDAFPYTNGMRCVFFAHTNCYPWEMYFRYDWAGLTNRLPPSESLDKLQFDDLTEALFPVDIEGGKVALFASNIVHLIRVQPCETNYYETLIHGMTNAYSRVKRDSALSLYALMASESKERLLEMLEDPRLSPQSRHVLKSYLYDRYKWLAPP